MNAVSSGASSVTPSPADGKMPEEEEPAMAPIAAVKIVKPVSVEALARPAWKVVMHCACEPSQCCVRQVRQARGLA